MGHGLLEDAPVAQGSSFSVTVPTRNRPLQLRACLEALARAREIEPFTVHVCDSSTRSLQAEVADICRAFPFTELDRHDGATPAAARNVCARVARSDLIVTVDDDVFVEPEAIKRLVDAYRRADGPRVVAGMIRFGEGWGNPGTMRRIGYGRALRSGERTSYLLTGLLLYPRAYALAWPWNERVTTKEDLFMSALWRRHGIRLLHEESARATHQGIPKRHDADEQANHIYVNLFDAAIANPDPLRAAGYELLGFAAGARVYGRSFAGFQRYLRAWAEGHRALLRDRHELRALCECRLPAATAEGGGTGPAAAPAHGAKRRASGGALWPLGPANGRAATTSPIPAEQVDVP